MKSFLILLVALLSLAFISSHADDKPKSRCTTTLTRTVSGKYSVAYVTTTTTLTQAQGTYTTTVFAEPQTVTVKRPATIVSTVKTYTKKITTSKALAETTVTVTDDALTASYTTTITSVTASVIKTVLLETSDAMNNFKIWSGLQLTLLLLGSLVFFI